MFSLFKKYPWQKVVDTVHKHKIYDVVFEVGKKPECILPQETIFVEDAPILSDRDLRSFLNIHTDKLQRDIFETNGYLAFLFNIGDLKVRGRLYLKQIGDVSPVFGIHICGQKGDHISLNEFENHDRFFEDFVTGKNVQIKGLSSVGKTQFVFSLFETYGREAVLFSEVDESLKDLQYINIINLMDEKPTFDRIVSILNTLPSNTIIIDHPHISKDVLEKLLSIYIQKKFVIICPFALDVPNLSVYEMKVQGDGSRVLN